MNVFDNEVVSVIIPVYNAEKFLDKTIDSVLCQTYSQIEIVVVDDCSIDTSEKVIRAYLNKQNNIVYSRLPHNSGAAVARNHALKLAKGRYVAFLDSDDLWYPQKIEKQLELMKRDSASICFTAIEIIDENGFQLREKIDVVPEINYAFLLRNTMIATSSVVVDRQQTGFFEMPLIKSGQDYATWLQLLRNGVIAHGITQVLVKYRKRHNSLSSNKLKSIKQVWDIQTHSEKINPIKVVVNILYFAINAFMKHYS